MRFRPLLWISALIPFAGVAVHSLQSTNTDQAHPIDAKSAGIGSTIPVIKASSVDGDAVTLPVGRAKFTVVAFTDTSCPLTVKYGPSISRLEDEYRTKGVEFIFVNPSSVDSAADIAETRKRLGLDGAYVQDGQGIISRALKPKTTTEMFVVNAKGVLVYRGAVDDQYGIGYARNEPRKTYLRDALNALLANKVPPVSATWAPGCLLAPLPEGTPQPEQISYHDQIERIIQKNCLTCHRDGGVAPFSLESYDQVVAKAQTIKYAVDRNYMPPWYAAHKGDGPSPWANDMSLSPADKQTLLTWIARNMPQGDPAKAPEALAFDPNWTIGKPDAVYQIPQPIAVKAEGIMTYQNVIVPTGLTEDKWVTALEIRPTARQVVHHVLVFILPPGEGNRMSQLDEVSGFFAGYVPGNGWRIYPEGRAKFLPKGSRLRFQIHYTPNGVATQDQTQLALQFGDKPPVNEVRTVGIANLRFAIPPGDARHQVTGTLYIPENVELLSYIPHMHVRGVAARYDITIDGAKTTMLDIPRYDFNWQLSYDLKKPFLAPRGSKIEFHAWYDNSAENPANPDPKRTVRWGDQTFDEMHLGYIEYIVPGLKAGDPMPILRPDYFGIRSGGNAESNPGLQMVEQIFKRLDKDADGFVTEAEAGAMWVQVKDADVNRDGKITLQEARSLFGG